MIWQTWPSKEPTAHLYTGSLWFACKQSFISGSASLKDTDYLLSHTVIVGEVLTAPDLLRTPFLRRFGPKIIRIGKPQWQKDMIDTRLAQYKNNPADVMDWDTIAAQFDKEDEAI